MKRTTAILLTIMLSAFSLYSQEVAEPVAAAVESSPVLDAVESAPAMDIVPAAQSSGEAVETVTVPLESSDAGSIRGGLISVSLKDVELSNVIRIFANLSDANIIVPDLGVEASAVKIDVNLKDVEWKPALQAILDGQDLELFEKMPGSAVYSVRKKLPPAEAIQNTRTFVFKNADIAQATEMIRGIVGDRGQVFAYAQANAIVVKTTQEIMDDVSQIAERIDTPRQQVLIQSRILELTDSKDRDLGVDWGKEGSGLLKRAVTISPDLQFAMGDLGRNMTTPVATGTEFDELTLNVGQLNVLLSALDQVANVKTVSSPKVIVANGETANIDILSKIPKLQRTLSQSQAAGGGTLTTVQVTQDDDGTDENTNRKRYAEYEFGIRLAVTPTVYSGENIAVKIVPIISRINESQTQRTLVGNINGTDIFDTYYATDEKRVETTFMLADKQTAVIGGLTEHSKEEQQKKVPLLSAIPLLGRLFSYNYTANVQKENIIFVTVSLEDGKTFDIEKAIEQSPLTRKQLIRDENNQIIDDRKVELFKGQDQMRVEKELDKLDKK